MNCPRDSSPLSAKTIGERSVETCPQCGGMYFEHGELNSIAGPTPGDLEFSTIDGDTFQHADDYGPIDCPRDGTTMKKVDFNIETAIILDFCPSCRGFWIDERELTRIREEVHRLDEAGHDVPDPLLVRISQFFWNLPLPH